MARKNSRARLREKEHSQSNDPLSLAWRQAIEKPLWRDPFLLSAFLLAGLLIAFQLGVILLHPSWRGQVTDWLRASLAWLGLLGSVLISHWLTRSRRIDALAWWIISAGFLMYAVAQSLWAVADQLVFPGSVPSPWWSDLFYLLQYPCFFLALLLLPRVPPGEQPVMTRMKVMLDCLLVLGAVTALSWYFLLAPLYTQSGESLFSKIVTLAYPVGDLGMLFGLVLTLAYRRPVEHSVLVLLIGAVASLALADSWSADIALHTIYIGGNPPDVFWMACYLLFSLAGLVQVRLVQREFVARSKGKPPAPEPMNEPALGGAVIGSFRFLLPFVAALLAGGVIVVQAAVTSNGLHHPLVSFGVAFGLLILVVARQELIFLESERWRREREVARIGELKALQDANRRMDTFLGMASHELKTPLTGIKLGLQVTARRFQRLIQRDAEMMVEFVPIMEGFARVERQEARLERLVNELLDVSRIQASKIELRMDLVDLAAIVREAVDEQSQAALYRTIRLHLPTNQQVPIFADADRIGQVVTNYLTNALKYSTGDRPVDVGLEIEEGAARVWVRDEGPGLPAEEQERIWERFHQARGVEVQSGTGVGLGLGLYICQTLIERHLGRIGVQSTPGVGSTFWFTLPLASKE